MPFIFLDESGQFKKQFHEDYFVVGSFTVGNYRRTEKQFKSWQKSKFPKKLRYLPEIKFSKIQVSDELRIKTVKFIADLDVRIHYVFLSKNIIPYNYYRKDNLQSGVLYTNVVGELLEMYLPINDKEFRVFCDQRHLKGIKRSKFKEILRGCLLPKLPNNSNVQIEMIDSTTNTNIQIADWIVGSIAWYLEKKPLGDELFKIFKNNLLKVDGKELFK